MLPFHCVVFGIGSFLSPEATTAIVVVIATMQNQNIWFSCPGLEAEVRLGNITSALEFNTNIFLPKNVLFGA